MALWQRRALSLIPDEEGWSVAAESRPGTSKLLRWNFAFPPPFPPLKQRFIFHSWGTQPLQKVAWKQVCFKHRGAGAGAGAGAACTAKWSHGSYWHLSNTLEEGERERPVFPLSAATLWLQGMFTFSCSKVTGGNEGRSRKPRLRLEWQASWHIRTGSPRKPSVSLFLFCQAEGSKKGSALEAFAPPS